MVTRYIAGYDKLPPLIRSLLPLREEMFMVLDDAV